VNWIESRGALLSTVAGAALLLLAAQASSMAQEEVKTLGRWLFDEGKGAVAGDGMDGTSAGRIVRATWGDGRSSPALVFEDYSLEDYLKPDVARATRVVVPHQDRLNPKGPFTLRAVIYPTRDPLYYGGIMEKGRGYGASYRLMLLRGLKVRGAIGPSHAAVTSKDPITLNSWHEVELSYDGTALVLEVDGKEQGRVSATKPSLSSTEDVVMGERFSGRIDEVALTAP
jgi:hypothetical protein